MLGGRFAGGVCVLQDLAHDEVAVLDVVVEVVADVADAHGLEEHLALLEAVWRERHGAEAAQDVLGDVAHELEVHEAVAVHAVLDAEDGVQQLESVLRDDRALHRDVAEAAGREVDQHALDARREHALRPDDRLDQRACAGERLAVLRGLPLLGLDHVRAREHEDLLDQVQLRDLEVREHRVLVTRAYVDHQLQLLFLEKLLELVDDPDDAAQDAPLFLDVGLSVRVCAEVLHDETGEAEVVSGVHVDKRKEAADTGVNEVDHGRQEVLLLLVVEAEVGRLCEAAVAREEGFGHLGVDENFGFLEVVVALLENFVACGDVALDFAEVRVAQHVLV